MTEYQNIIYLILGLILLLGSGEFLVKGSVSLAKHLNISTLVIGVTVVSFGTSAPELLVSLQGALSGHPDIAIGNIIGSNIANIALVLGVTAIILPMPVKKNSMSFDWVVMIIASFLFYIFISTNLLFELWEGIVFVVFLSAFLYWSVYKSRKDTKAENQDLLEIPKLSIWLSLVFIVISSIGLIYGADMLVKGATGIAFSFGVSESVISLTVIALGTSLPELSTSVIAAFRKETDISVGNIIGSNIFNIFGIIGITGVVTPIKISEEILSNSALWMLGTAFLLLIILLPKKLMLGRIKGTILLLCYLLYIYFII